MATAADIFKVAQQQIQALQEVDGAIGAKINAIKVAHPGIPLTQDQLAAQNLLEQQKASVLNASEELQYVTITALDNSVEINNLTAALAGVVADLNLRTAAISAIGGAAANIGTISATVSGLIPQLKALLKG